MSRPTPSRSRRHLKVRGIVQGVGFRPAVYRLAVEQGLTGFVRNDGNGVTIEIEGDDDAVSSFGDAMRSRQPPAARIDAIDTADVQPRNERTFRVDASVDGGAGGSTEIPADRATCDDCVGELFDPRDRRYRYPFITCTNCGPRYTITGGVPYDRARTTMAPFAMCAACRREYEDPDDRRFHAETIACARCGPVLGAATIEDAIGALHGGLIVAVKGLGGFHLAVDASNDRAVLRLRERKGRPDRPFAVMARDIDVASRCAVVDDAARTALLHPARPVVCLPSRHTLAPSVAPRLSDVGIMLPYTPLHHLLLAGGPDVLVMTSGNRTEEPIIICDDEAVAGLESIADVWLLHDRAIQTRADDSVVRMAGGAPIPVRRSRGFVPEIVRLPFRAPRVVAVGAELKNTVCVTRDDIARLSPHLGDLSHPRVFALFEAMLKDVEAEAVAHDLHPDYRSTRWALTSNLPRVAVQHHHAHIASCLAENGRTHRVIGVAFDGTGCGPAGELWGGEFLVCDLAGFQRVGHLRAIALPGGEAAIREPWRLAVAARVDAGLPVPDSDRARVVARLSERLAPRTTSAGRWFDAVAALAGLRQSITYEGQAAMELEAVAEPQGEAYPYLVTEGEIDLRPTVRAIVAGGEGAAVIAARFHETLVRSAADVCDSARAASGIETVALSGGCFQNKRLSEGLRLLLERRGFEVLRHRVVPPNDGGISLGQAAVAAWRLRERGTER